jgi:hypothetical protein
MLEADPAPLTTPDAADAGPATRHEPLGGATI